jgi:hypothetical protein
MVETNKNVVALNPFKVSGHALPGSGQQVGDHAKKGGMFAAIMAGQQITAELTDEASLTAFFELVEQGVFGLSDNVRVGAFYTKLGLGKAAQKEGCDFETFEKVALKMAEIRKVKLPEDWKKRSRFEVIKIIVYAPWDALRTRRPGEKDDRAGKQMSFAMLEYRRKMKELQELNEIQQLVVIHADAAEGKGPELPAIAGKTEKKEPKPPTGKEMLFKAHLTAVRGQGKAAIQTIIDAWSTPVAVENGEASCATGDQINKWFAQWDAVNRSAEQQEQNEGQEQPALPAGEATPATEQAPPTAVNQ